MPQTEIIAFCCKRIQTLNRKSETATAYEEKKSFNNTPLRFSEKHIQAH